MSAVSSKYFTIPNYISLSRLFVAIIIFWLWFSERIFNDEIARILVLIVLFTIGSLTDMLDGYWARRFKEKSKVGAFLDSLVDKCFTLSFFAMYLYIDFIKISWVLIFFIVVREIYVTVMRIYISWNNQVMFTEQHGKLKVTLQMIFQGTMWIYILFFAIVYETKLFQEYLFSQGSSTVKLLDLNFDTFATFFSAELGIKQFWVNFLLLYPNYMLAVVTVFTVFSGISYILKNRAAVNP